MGQNLHGFTMIYHMWMNDHPRKPAMTLDDLGFQGLHPCRKGRLRKDEAREVGHPIRVRPLPGATFPAWCGPHLRNASICTKKNHGISEYPHIYILWDEYGLYMDYKPLTKWDSHPHPGLGHPKTADF
jgi:hypothetical protein